MRPVSEDRRTAPGSSVAVERGLVLAFYAVFGVAMVVLVTRFQANFLPGGLSAQIGHNSESFMLALAVVPTVLHARPRWLQPGRAWVCPAIAAVWLLLGVGVYYLGWDTTVITLNEPLLAAGLITLAVGPPRPWVLGPVVPLVLVVVTALFFDTQLVRQQAECVVAVVAVLLAFDVFDRGVLTDGAHESPRALTYTYYAFLLVWPAVMLASRVDDPEGVVERAVDYMGRGAEGFWGALMIVVFFRILRRFGDRASTTTV